MSAYTHNCFACAEKDREIQRLTGVIADLREELATALHLADVHRDGHERQLNLLNELRQSTWIGSAADMVD